MKEKEIFEKIELLKKQQGFKKTKKFTGAMTSEVIREYLKQEGFNISERDVFVKGVPNEIDLLILKKETKSIFNNYYDPKDILVAFELKSIGIYGKEELPRIKNMFDSMKKENPSIICIYLTIYENQKHSYRATKDNLNVEVFELFSPTTNIESAIKKGIFYESITGDWGRLIKYLRSSIQKVTLIQS